MCFCTAAQYEEEAQVIHSVRRVYNACFNSDMHIQYDRACIPDQAECGLRTDPASYQVVRPSERKHVFFFILYPRDTCGIYHTSKRNKPLGSFTAMMMSLDFREAVKISIFLQVNDTATRRQSRMYVCVLLRANTLRNVCEYDIPS